MHNNKTLTIASKHFQLAKKQAQIVWRKVGGVRRNPKNLHLPISLYVN